MSYRGLVFWQQPRIQWKLQKFEGILERGGKSLNYLFYNSTLNIPTTIPIDDRSMWKKKVSFVIGLSWAGPVAYNVLLLETWSSSPGLLTAFTSFSVSNYATIFDALS